MFPRQPGPRKPPARAVFISPGDRQALEVRSVLEGDAMHKRCRWKLLKEGPEAVKSSSRAVEQNRGVGQSWRMPGKDVETIEEPRMQVLWSRFVMLSYNT
jgi:hypothetical protein